MFCLLLALAVSAGPPAAWGPTPSREQLQFHREELSSFIHFGVNTFTGREWGDGSEDPDVFKPLNLSTDQWVETLQRAGFKRIIITSKHHDGFCLFKSRYTRHQVNESRDFQAISRFLHQSGDVLEEFSKSCTRYNMSMGLYLSPWDRNSSLYGDDTKYNEYYMNQLTEILSNHEKYGNRGKFVEMWLDSAKGEGEKDQTYWFSRWFEVIKRHQPQMIVYSDYGSEARWVGNENGIAGEPCWSKFDCENQKHCFDNLEDCKDFDLGHGDPKGPDYSIAECDVSLTDGWFWTKGREPKTMEELSDIYFKSVGRGQPLLLNVPPNTDGQLPSNFVERVLEFGETIRKSFEHDFAQEQQVEFEASNTRGGDDTFSPKNVADNSTDTYWTMDDEMTTGEITVDFKKYVTINLINIREHMPLGQRISKFAVDVHTKDNEWQLFCDGPTIGNRRICRSEKEVAVDKMKLRIVESQAVPVIEEFGAFKGVGAFARNSRQLKGLDNKKYEMNENRKTRQVLYLLLAFAAGTISVVAALTVFLLNRKKKESDIEREQEKVEFEKMGKRPFVKENSKTYTSA